MRMSIMEEMNLVMIVVAIAIGNWVFHDGEK